jgi:hypothetical protein
VVLRDGYQALIQQKLEAKMISADQEAAAPKVGPLVADGEHQTCNGTIQIIRAQV